MKDKCGYIEKTFAEVERQEDIVFHTATNHRGEREELRLDVTLPAGDARGKRRVILWIHGGGFRPGNDKQQSYIVRIAGEFARRGYVCFSCDYRVRENPMDDLAGTMRDAADDCRAALAWIKAHASQFGIDGERVVVGGGSAGGMTAVNLCALEANEGPSAGVPAIAALVNLWGSPFATDMLAKVDGRYPPTIIVHGTADVLVPHGNSEALAADLERHGVHHQMILIEGAPHTPVTHMESFSDAIARFLADVMPGC